MEPQEGRSFHRPLANDTIAAEMEKEIFDYSRTAIDLENEQLAIDLAIIDDALSSRGVDNWMPVRSVINIFTDITEIETFVESVPPTSRFYKNYTEVETLVKALQFWVDQLTISNQDTLVKAYNAMANQLNGNTLLLEKSLPQQ